MNKFYKVVFVNKEKEMVSAWLGKLASEGKGTIFEKFLLKYEFGKKTFPYSKDMGVMAFDNLESANYWRERTLCSPNSKILLCEGVESFDSKYFFSEAGYLAMAFEDYLDNPQEDSHQDTFPFEDGALCEWLKPIEEIKA